MRLGRLLILLAVVVVVSAAVASGVTYGLVRRDSAARAKPLPPVALVGVLRDTSGRPVANALVQLTATDATNAKIGVPIPVHQLGTTHTDAAGRFTLRQSQSVPVIRTMAAENGNWVNFEVDFRSDGHWMPWGIPRKISHRSWLADDNPDMPAALKVERLTFKPL